MTITQRLSFITITQDMNYKVCLLNDIIYESDHYKGLLYDLLLRVFQLSK